MIVRRAFYWWQFPAAVILPAWLLVGWGLFGSSGWSLLGLLVLCPIIFIALVAVGGIIFARATVRRERAVSWRDVGILAAWQASIVGFGFFGPATGWFALAGIAIGLAAFWMSLAELFRDTSRRLRETMDYYEQAAKPTSAPQPPIDGGEYIVIQESRG